LSKVGEVWEIGDGVFFSAPPEDRYWVTILLLEEPFVRQNDIKKIKSLILCVTNPHSHHMVGEIKEWRYEWFDGLHARARKLF
jgi:hypothetical protein